VAPIKRRDFGEKSVKTRLRPKTSIVRSDGRGGKYANRLGCHYLIEISGSHNLTDSNEEQEGKNPRLVKKKRKKGRTEKYKSHKAFSVLKLHM